jgi:hypothetical protein
VTAYLAPPIRQLFLNPSNGAPAAGFQLFVYYAGTTTKATTFISAGGGTPNLNPIILDSLGECDLWLLPGVAYKIVFAPPGDTDPPTNPIWTRDNVQSEGTAFPTFASAKGANLSGLSLIYIQGFYSPGDGGGAWWVNVPMQPYHTVYFQGSDGSFWEPAVSEFDPRIFGARADAYMFSFATIPGSDTTQVNIADSTFPGFLQSDIGKNFVLWDYPCAHTLANSTIAAVLSPNTIRLAVAASGATSTNSNAFYSSDDTTIINSCMSFCGTNTSAFGAGPPPAAFWNSDQFNAANAGGHVMRFRSYDRNTSRYGISSSLLPINSTTMQCDDGACLFALGTFPASTSMVSQQNGAQLQKVSLVDMTLQGNGFAAVGLQPSLCDFYEIRDGVKIYNCTTSGIVLGAVGAISTWSFNGKIHIEGIATTMPGYINNASGLGISVPNGADGKCPGDIEIMNYRAGMNISSGDVDFTGQVHIFTNSQGGYFTQGVTASSADVNFAKLTIDSLWGPMGTTCYGLTIAGSSCNVNHYACYLHTGAAPALDNSCVPIRYTSQNFGQSFPPGSRLGSRIDSVYAQTNDTSVKFAQIVDAGEASNLWLDIGSINTDGNYYDMGWETQEQRALASLNANTASHSQILIGYAKNIQAGSTSALWYPDQIAGQIAFWIDPNIVAISGRMSTSLPGSVQIDSNNNVKGWYSRLGKSRLIQSNLGQRPAYGSNAWAGTAGGVAVPTLAGITFNGTGNVLLIDDFITNQQEVRIFACLIPGSSTASASGPVFAFNNPTVGGGTLVMAGAGTSVSFENDSFAGHSSATVSGTPVLVTGIWSAGGSDGTTGIFGRVNGGSNTATQTFTYVNKSMGMGGTVASNVLGNPINFTIGPVIVVVGSMTTAQEQVVEGYLAWQFFGNTGGHSAILPNTHPYYAAAPLANAVA